MNVKVGNWMFIEGLTEFYFMHKILGAKLRLLSNQYYVGTKARTL